MPFDMYGEERPNTCSICGDGCEAGHFCRTCAEEEYKLEGTPFEIYGIPFDYTCKDCGGWTEHGEACSLCTQMEIWNDPDWPELGVPVRDPDSTSRLYGTVEFLDLEDQFRLRFSVEVPKQQSRSILDLNVEEDGQGMPVAWSELDPGQCKIMETLQRQIAMNDPEESQPDLQQKFLKSRRSPNWHTVIPDVCEVNWSLLNGYGTVCLSPIGGLEGKNKLYLHPGRVLVWNPPDLRPKLTEITEATRKPVQISR